MYCVDPDTGEVVELSDEGNNSDSERAQDMVCESDLPENQPHSADDADVAKAQADVSAPYADGAGGAGGARGDGHGSEPAHDHEQEEVKGALGHSMLDTVAEVAGEAAEVCGEVPGVGTLIHGPQSVYNSLAAGIDMIAGDPNAAREHAAEAGIHAVESVPFLGTGVGMVELATNAAATKPEDTFSEQVARGLFGDKVSYSHNEAADPAPPDTYKDPAQPSSGSARRGGY